jgi:tetratricopeptide (TPR) repeat protein
MRFRIFSPFGNGSKSPTLSRLFSNQNPNHRKAISSSNPKPLGPRSLSPCSSMMAMMHLSYQNCIDGIDSARQGNSAQAMEAFITALESNPASISARFCMGLYLQARNRYDQALKQFNTAIRLAAHHPYMVSRLYRCRGVLRYQIGKYTAAFRDLNRALVIDPEFIEVLQIRGTWYLESSEYVQAIDDFTAALKIDPEMDCTIAARDEAVRCLQQQLKAAKIAASCQNILDRHLFNRNDARLQHRHDLDYCKPPLYEDSTSRHSPNANTTRKHTRRRL